VGRGATGRERISFLGCLIALRCYVFQRYNCSKYIDRHSTILHPDKEEDPERDDFKHYFEFCVLLHL
jgi:hypothetical protein